MSLSTQMFRALLALPLFALGLSAPFLSDAASGPRLTPVAAAPPPIETPLCLLPEAPAHGLPLTQVPADLGRFGLVGRRAEPRCRA